MIQFLLIIFLGILPAFLLVGYIYKLDSLKPEPIPQLVKGVGYGVGSIVLALLLSNIIGIFVPCFWAEGSLGEAFYTAFFMAALPEECAKLFMLYLLVRNNPYFDEKMDGIVYAVAVGMGFAGFENVSYLFSNIEDWHSVAISRAIFSVPGHFAFAVLMGYYYGIVHFSPERYGKYRYMILLAPVLAHGIFDVLLLAAPAVGEVVAVLLYLVFIYFCYRLHKFCHGRMRVQLLRDKKDLDAEELRKALGQFGHYNKDENA